MIGISLKSLESDIFTRYVVFEWNIMKYFIEPDMTRANSLIQLITNLNKIISDLLTSKILTPNSRNSIFSRIPYIRTYICTDSTPTFLPYNSVHFFYISVDSVFPYIVATLKIPESIRKLEKQLGTISS